MNPEELFVYPGMAMLDKAPHLREHLAFKMLLARLYNNDRDDHIIVRELTRASAIIQQREGIAKILLMPTIEFQPATRRIVQEFLAQTSQRINEHFAGRFMPIEIQLLNEDSNDLNIDQHGLHWVSSASSGQPIPGAFNLRDKSSKYRVFTEGWRTVTQPIFQQKHVKIT